MVYSRAERVFILEHYFASKSFATIREAFSKAYPDMEVPNKTIHLRVTKFWDTGSVCDRKLVQRRTVLTDGKVKEKLRTELQFFGERVVGSGFWPPRSPDLTPPHLFLLGLLKERFHSNNPRSSEELKHSIEPAVANTDQETLTFQNVVRNTLKRVDACLREGGERFQRLL
jgi:hypothetical protein